MNPRPAEALDRDALVDQLARLDSDNPSDAAIAPPLTVSGLKAELDTLIVQLREPATPAPYADESGLQRAQELVLAIGVEPESKARADHPELGRIGPYELLEKLGEGGMGAVYKALHTSLEKIVALKVLPQDRLSSQAVSRFKREMKAVGKLDHPNIVRATDAGEADGNHFLVMEYVEGVDLSELLRRVGPLAVAEACELVRQAAVGLQHAHQRGMVHRDIKPSNIMLAWSDEHAPSVKILDMGLALLSEPVSPAPGELTVSGSIMGTLEYMSPEQSQDTHQVDIRADIYSLGATLYKLLCGKAPFSVERFNTPGKLLVALATETPPSIGKQRDGLPAGLIAVVDRMLARAPSDRPATPADVGEELAPFASGADLKRLAHAARHPGTALDALPVTELLRPRTDRTPVAEVVRLRTDRTLTSSATASSATASSVAGNSATASELPTTHALGERGYAKAIMAAVGLFALLGGVVLFGGQITRIVTNQGQIVIETDGVGIEVVLKDNQGKVLDTETKREITFQAGEYDIEVTVKDSAGEQRFVTDHFNLSRNGKKIVDARWEVAKAKIGSDRSLTTSATVSTDPDRRAAEWVLSIGGEIMIKGDGPEQRIKAGGELPQKAFELTNVSLIKNSKVSDASLARFQNCTNLTHLYLNENLQVTDAGLAHFQNGKSFVSLSLRGTKVSDVGLAHFRDCNLTMLDLSHTKISDAGLAHFLDCRNLSSVALVGTQVSDAGLAQLKACKNIKDLELTGTRVSDAGMAHLKELKHLRRLGLESTQVTDAGLEMFGDWPKLHVLLKHTNVTEAGVKKLSNAWPQSRIEWDGGVVEQNSSTDPDRRAAEWVLSIYGMVTIQENGRELKPGRVSELPRGAFELTAVQLGSNPQVTDAGLAHFKDCQNLKTLNLERNKLSDAGLVYFKDCKKLEVLHLLVNRGVTDEGLSHFADCENLTSLNLDGTQVTDAGLSRFRNLKNLTTLNLTGTRVTDAGMSHFKNCQNLKTLNLAQTSVSDVGLANFEDCHSLMVLNLSHTQVSNVGLAHFKEFRHLYRVELESTRVSDGWLDQLKARNNLAFLNLRDLRLSDAVVADLAGLSRLQHLNLANTRMSRRGFEQLSAALPKFKFEWSEPNRNVAAYVLAVGGSVEISRRDELESHPIKAVADLPRDYFQVRRVSLVEVNAPLDKLLPAIGELHFPEFDRLEGLDLSRTTLLSSPQSNLDFLAGIHGLKELNLADAGLKDGSLKKLPILPTLKRLVLDGNDLRGQGLSRLSGFTQLESLELRRTRVSATSIAELKQALPNCKITADLAEER